MSAYFYIDGFNLYHALDATGDNRLKWLDHVKLAKTLLRGGETLGGVYFFTAVVTWDRSKQQRHRAYLAALTAAGVTIVEGNFKKQPKHCFDTQRTCIFREEKKTDVDIACKMIADAVSGRASRCVLVTADSDQVPTIQTLRNLCPDVKLTLCYPPRRKREATELGGLFQGRDRKELKPGLLHRCLLPRNVLDTKGRIVASRPASYTT